MIAEAQPAVQEIPAVIETDGGPHVRNRERLCAATRTVRPVSELIRFVIGPEGEVVADIKSRLPGRGLWVTATRDALNEAIRRRAFSRGFRREVRVGPDLVAHTEALLERAVTDALAMAGKGGLVATGFTKTEQALAHSKVVALVHAAGAAPDGTRKLDAAWRRERGGQPSNAIEFLTSAQLDLALGRPNVIHAALLAGPVSETFLERCRRLERFRTGDQHNRTGQATPNSSGQGRDAYD